MRAIHYWDLRRIIDVDLHVGAWPSDCTEAYLQN